MADDTKLAVQKAMAACADETLAIKARVSAVERETGRITDMALASLRRAEEHAHDVRSWTAGLDAHLTRLEESRATDLEELRARAEDLQRSIERTEDAIREHKKAIAALARSGFHLRPSQLAVLSAVLSAAVAITQILAGVVETWLRVRYR
jgi:chromosome segregation ATPase